MAAIKLLNLLAISSLAIFACSFRATPVNALSSGSHNVARHAFRGHDSIAKRKRGGSSKRCKPRPTTTSAPAKTPPAKTPPAQNTGHNDAVSSSSGGSSGGGSGSSGGSGFGHSGGGKVGVSWANGNDPSLSQYKSGKVGALYTWSPELPPLAKSLGFNAIPMLWGEDQIDDFARLVVQGYANTVLGFNEPNESGQSNMSPQRGAQLWQQYIQPLKAKGYQLISPATSSSPAGKIWMQDFFKACGGCSFDGIAIHYYDVTPQGFIEYITDFHNTFNLPVWATEYACQNFNGGPQCSQAQTNSFHQQISSFMDNTPWVAHYFPFGVMHDMQGVNAFNQLMAPSGAPTALGYQYFN
jgi:hypothetical protein